MKLYISQRCPKSAEVLRKPLPSSVNVIDITTLEPSARRGIPGVPLLITDSGQKVLGVSRITAILFATTTTTTANTTATIQQPPEPYNPGTSFCHDSSLLDLTTAWNAVLQTPPQQQPYMTKSCISEKDFSTSIEKLKKEREQQAQRT